ncbi:MAG: T9SS type A sorting domain-containing protein [Candidatus Zixiibacteriota bacterium]|nr:MAG: T9SS type A sorting domain-containing protein [candidate division Zixibacteria bacterium]
MSRSIQKIFGLAMVFASLLFASQSVYADSVWTAYTMVNSPLPTDYVSGIDFDNNGNQYVGTTGGGMVHIKDSVWTVWNQSNTGVPINAVRLAVRDANDTLWLGAASGNLDSSPYGFGVARLNPVDSTWAMVNHGIEVNQIVTGIIFTDTLRYVSTYGGGVTVYSDSGWIRYRYTTRTEFRYSDSSLQVFDVPPGTYLPSDYIRAMDKVDWNGTVWFATATGGAVRKIGGDWFTFNTGNSGLPSNQLWSIRVNQVNGEVYFGTAGFGVAVYSCGNWTVYNSSNSPFTNNLIASLGVNPSGDELWIGTGYGVWVRENDGDWRAYLPEVNNFIWGEFYSDIAFDSIGNVWVSAYGGGMASLFLDSIPQPPPDSLEIDVNRMFIFFYNNRPKERIFTTMTVTGAPEIGYCDTICYRLESDAGELYSFSVPFSEFRSWDPIGDRTTYRYKHQKLTIFLRVRNDDPSDIYMSIKDMDAGMNRENYRDTLTVSMSIGDAEGSVVIYLVEGNQMDVTELNVEGEINTARAYGFFRQQTTDAFSGEVPPLAQDLNLTNYPNPFNGSTVIKFSIAEAGMVDVMVYDILGRQVSSLFSGYLYAGNHYYAWPAAGERAPKSGVYYYRVTINGRSETGKMMFLK